MKEYNGFEFVRTYAPDEKFPKEPDFTHGANSEEPFWEVPEKIELARFGLKSSCAVYRRMTDNQALDSDGKKPPQVSLTLYIKKGD